MSSFWRPALGPWLVATTVTGACKVKFIDLTADDKPKPGPMPDGLGGLVGY